MAFTSKIGAFSILQSDDSENDSYERLMMEGTASPYNIIKFIFNNIRYKHRSNIFKLFSQETCLSNSTDSEVYFLAPGNSR